MDVKGTSFNYFSLPELEKAGLVSLEKLPFSIRILLENMLRNENGTIVMQEDIEKVLQYNPNQAVTREIPFMPARVILQDFTGVPAVVDLASMRDALKELGGNPEQINPVVPADLVIDHSVQVDVFGTLDAYERNVAKEYERNGERYRLLKWAQKSFRNFSVVPPGTGIVHQVNLEYLGNVVMSLSRNNSRIVYPDTLVGTDSHTTMINGLSVLGWGVGGIEAEAVMLGQPYYMVIPEVVGVKLTGLLPEGATATDLVLTITEKLRKLGVVGKFVEYFGSGLTNLSLPDRATIANMSPEYGATMGFFPVDSQLLDYLKMTARPQEQIDLVEAYTKEQGLFRTDHTPDPSYQTVLEVDLSTIEASLSGPKRPQDRIPLNHMKESFYKSLKELFGKPLPEYVSEENGQYKTDLNAIQKDGIFTHGSVVIAAITSCTNTSNPSVMISAGLLAQNALEKGIKTKPWVKTSLAPGSRVVTDYLEAAGLMDSLNQQGFSIVGYGCTTCIGNSGPLPEHIDRKIKEDDLVVSAVLSGNRNFEGRIHPSVRANYLASPPLVVAYALAGRTDIDFETEPLGTGKDGKPVYLRDIWPDQQTIAQRLNTSLNPEMFQEKYSEVFEGDEHWQSMKVEGGKLYEWDEKSTYIKNPPFFTAMAMTAESPKDIKNARVLALLGDSVTTDHISPAGTIQPKSPAGKYLLYHGVEIKDFNSYGSRRGNHEVMMRGTFANIRIRNKLLDGIEGGYTRYFPTGEQMAIYDAAMAYQKANTPLIVIAGKEYGTGSSRDWAAKGTLLLGIRAIIAESFERIHRSNLVGMGVLPLQFLPGDSAEKLGLTGLETYEILGIEKGLKPGQELTVKAVTPENVNQTFNVKARLDTAVDVLYYENGGILQTVLRQLAKK